MIEKSGHVSWYVFRGRGVTDPRDRDSQKHAIGKTIFISKEIHQKVVKDIDILEAKPMKIALAAHFCLTTELSPQILEEQYMSHVLYSSAVWSIMYAIVCIRPDISYDVSVVSHYIHKSGKVHSQVVKWINLYLRGTISICLMYHRDDERCELVGFHSYSDFTGNLDHRRSLTGIQSFRLYR